jgi:chemotaxis protein histidine kinase CheA
MSDDLVREFLVESTENLDTLDRELVLLEKDPRDAKLLASVFRTIHTIKGTCGFLGFTKLEKVAHAGENLLASLRDGKLELRTEIASGLMSMVDAVRHMLETNCLHRSGRTRRLPRLNRDPHEFAATFRQSHRSPTTSRSTTLSRGEQ